MYRDVFASFPHFQYDLFSSCLNERFTNTAKLKDHLVLELRCLSELSFSFQNSMRRIVPIDNKFHYQLNLYTYFYTIRFNN